MSATAASQPASGLRTGQPKHLALAYALWLVLGPVGGHRFYTGRFGTGVTMAVLSFTGAMWALITIGLYLLAIVGVWMLIDAFLIPGWIRRDAQGPSLAPTATP